MPSGLGPEPANDGGDGKSDMPSGLIPSHKQSMALFLERVYGVDDDRDLFFGLLEDAFLSDLRTATMLEKAEGESDMGLALNRYIGSSILPMLIKYRWVCAGKIKKNHLVKIFFSQTWARNCPAFFCALLSLDGVGLKPQSLRVFRRHLK